MIDGAYDLVVVGHGAAGLTAALAAAEAAEAKGKKQRILVLERAHEGAHGGNTRFTPCYMRLEAPDRLSSSFVDDMMVVSNGRNDRGYFQRLAAEAPRTISWLQRHHIDFHQPVYYLSAGPARIQPIGGGDAIVRELARAARSAGIQFAYSCEGRSLVCNATGRLSGIKVHANGREQVISTTTVVLASGGFQGNPELLQKYLGAGGETLQPISPGTRLNRGEGIQMALAVGAKHAGDWSGMHIEPIDPRAKNSAAVVLVYPYGIVVDRSGNRFFNEGGGLVHETWESFARAIHFERPQGIVYAILDSRLREVQNFERAIRSEVPPIEARTLDELAKCIDVPVPKFTQTVAAYNAAGTGISADFDATIKDGLASASDLSPIKSNWARKLDKPPYLAWPLIGAIAYTFGGLATDYDGRVLGNDGPIPGLFAAGEITGHFHGTAPNAVSVLRAVVFGRIAGTNAALEYD